VNIEISKEIPTKYPSLRIIEELLNTRIWLGQCESVGRGK